MSERLSVVAETLPGRAAASRETLTTGLSGGVGGLVGLALAGPMGGLSGGLCAAAAARAIAGATAPTERDMEHAVLATLSFLLDNRERESPLQAQAGGRRLPCTASSVREDLGHVLAGADIRNSNRSVDEQLRMLGIRDSIRSDRACAVAAVDVAEERMAQTQRDARAGTLAPMIARARWAQAAALLANASLDVLRHVYLNREEYRQLVDGATYALTMRGGHLLGGLLTSQAQHLRTAVTDAGTAEAGRRMKVALEVLARNVDRFERFRASSMAGEAVFDGEHLDELIEYFEDTEANGAPWSIDDWHDFQAGLDDRMLRDCDCTSVRELLALRRAADKGTAAPPLPQEQVPSLAAGAPQAPEAAPARKQRERRARAAPTPEPTLPPAPDVESAAPGRRWRRDGVASTGRKRHHDLGRNKAAKKALRDLAGRPGKQWRHLEAVNQERERRSGRLA